MTDDRKDRDFYRREREILDAALSLMTGDDWKSVTVEQIATRAGVGKGTVYKHFESKEELYAHLVLDFHRILLRRLGGVVTGEGARRRLGPILRAIWETHRAHPEYHRLLEYALRAEFVSNLPPRIQGELLDVGNRLREHDFGHLRAAVEAGELPDVPIERLYLPAAATMNGALVALWNRWLSDGPGDGGASADPWDRRQTAAAPDEDAFIELLIDFVIAGLTNLPPPAGAEPG